MMTETLMTDAATPSEGASTQTGAAATPAEGAQAAATAQTAQTAQAPGTETQAAEGTKPEGDKAADKPQGAPEKYEFKPPEGREFDAAVLEQFSEVARELNLPQEAAQKVIDKIAPALAEKQARLVEEVRAGWVEGAKADKEFGGEKLAENLAVAKKALEAFGSPELKTLLNETGLGNHPELIRAFYRAGKQISEDRFVPGGGNAAQPTRSAAEVLYDNK